MGDETGFWEGLDGWELDADREFTCQGRRQFCRGLNVSADGKIRLFEESETQTAMYAMSANVDADGKKADVDIKAQGKASAHPLDGLARDVNACIAKHLDKMDHPEGLTSKDVHIIMTRRGWFFRYVVDGPKPYTYVYLYPEERNIIGKILHVFTRRFERKKVKVHRDHDGGHRHDETRGDLSSSVKLH